MPRIQRLSPSLISKIAAGEVIERPASVVKELLENALDAGSTRIEVELEQGGLDLIRVVDNGGGILADDLPLAFASHATSKLASAEDLFHIGTLGFRGEALASIGGVGQVTLQSRPADQASGAEITCQGGELSAIRAWNGAPGTRIEVRHLFFNTPVRRKFLRTAATELGRITEVFTRLALAHLGVHFTLRHKGKLVHDVPVSATLMDRIGLFFGKDVRDSLYPLQAEHGAIKLSGFIANPACERGNAQMQYVFVNGRWVRDRSLGHAVQQAYRGLLMSGRYAVAFLFLEVPTGLVDVNVHPTKAEVRFQDSQSFYRLVLHAVRSRLQGEDLTARLGVPQAVAARVEDPGNEATSPSGGTRPDQHPAYTGSAVPLARQASASSAPRITGPSPCIPAPWEIPDTNAASSATHPPPAPGSTQAAMASERFNALQLYNTYLAVETPEGLLVIDQHALHERILFEELRSRLRSGPLEAQRLLIPEPVEFPADQAALALESREPLIALGLGVEAFGGGTLLLTSYPAILGKRPPPAILRAVVDYLAVQDRVPDREHLLHDVLSLMACHAAVRAGDALTAEQMAALVARRDLATDTHHCPHGRPTSLLFSRHDLERQFGRI